MYTVVEFEDGSSELVPKLWIKGKQCFWPPMKVNPAKVSQWIKQRVEPKSNWSLHPILKIMGEADSYKVGRQKAVKAVDESELSSDPNNYGKGQRKRKPKFYEDYEIEDIENSNSSASPGECSPSILDMLPSPPKLSNSLTFNDIPTPSLDFEGEGGTLIFDTGNESQMQHSLVVQPSTKGQFQHLHGSFNSSDSIMQQSPSSELSPKAQFPHLFSIEDVHSSDSQKQNPPVSQATPKARFQRFIVNAKSSAILKPRNQPSQPACKSVNSSRYLGQPSKSPLSEIGSPQTADFQRLILKELKLIRYRQEQQENILQLILERSDLNKYALNSTPPKVFKLKLPAESDSELQDLNHALLDNDQKNELTARLQALGGSDFKDHCRRALRYLMTDSVAILYSWVGSKEKKKFSSLLVSDVIIESVTEKHTTRNTIENVIKVWFRHAKERRAYAAKKNVQ